MKRFKALVAVLVLLVFLVPTKLFAQDNNSSENARAAIEEIYLDFEKQIEEGNAEEIVNKYYTEDAIFYPPTGGVATGKQEIKNVLSGMIQSGVVVDLNVKELEVFGNMAYEYGVATIKSAADGTQLDQNEYVVLWKKDQGKWKIHRDFIKGSTKNH